MMSRHHEPVYIVFGDVLGDQPWPTGLLAFRGWLDEQIAKVPPERRDAAEITVKGCEDGGEWAMPYAKITIAYPPTPAEIEERKARKRAYLAEKRARLAAR